MEAKILGDIFRYIQNGSIDRRHHYKTIKKLKQKALSLVLETRISKGSLTAYNHRPLTAHQQNAWRFARGSIMARLYMLPG